MPKNKEVFAQQLETIFNSGFQFGLNSDGTPFECGGLYLCPKCEFHQSMSPCSYCRKMWLNSEYDAHEPKPKLSNDEYTFLKMFHDVWVRIARDKDCELYLYFDVPDRGCISWKADSCIELKRSYFPFITWESGKAWSIEELLELEVME